jgi:translation initiation factor 3 subunit C
MNRQVIKTLQSGSTPKIYVKKIADLEELVKETNEKQKTSGKKMNTASTKGFNAMKQKIRKNNATYQTDIQKYLEDKDAFMDESDDDEPVAAAPKEKKSKVQRLDDLEAAIDEEGWGTVGRGGKALVYTPESILKHLRTIVESRGKKNTDRAEQIRIMEKLLEVANTPYQKIRVLLTIISTRFDVIGTSTQNYMSQDAWKAAEREYSLLLQTMEENPTWMVVEGAEEWEDDEKAPSPAVGELFKIPGSVVSLAERLGDELTRSLQQTDPHTADYIERLSDEQLLYNDILRSSVYAERMKKTLKEDGRQDPINRIAIRRLEHIYFKPVQVVKILEEKAWAALPSKLDCDLTPRGSNADVPTLVQTLCNYLFENAEGIIRARAMLCEIYFLALQDNYYKARDLALMSHLTENISSFDVSTQILFNRTLVQIGLCAFRAGLCYEAQGVLQEICGSGRQKELLAQGLIMQRYSTVTPEQERLERQRQLPFHMHINLELLECVYLTCSMLLEIPLLAQTGSSPDIRKRVISKTFRRMLEYTEKQVFQGPPENTRDHVMQAAKALANGDWKKCQELIAKIAIWDLLGADKERINTMLASQIQEEGLRTYLFTYAPYYDTLSITTLGGMFDLDSKQISAIVSKMISHEELAAALDQVNDAIIFRKGVDLSRLQSQVITLSEKAMGILEGNEKVLETRTAGMTNAFQRDQGQRGRGRGRGRGGLGGGLGRGGGRTPGGQQFSGGALGNAIKT